MRHFHWGWKRRADFNRTRREIQAKLPQNDGGDELSYHTSFFGGLLPVRFEWEITPNPSMSAYRVRESCYISRIWYALLAVGLIGVTGGFIEYAQSSPLLAVVSFLVVIGSILLVAVLVIGLVNLDSPIQEFYRMVDEFGRSFEEQLQDEISNRYWIRRQQYLEGEYNTDTSHLDGEDLPHSLQVIYQDGGPQYSVESYLPTWHHRKAIELLDDSYEALLEYFQTGEKVPDGGQQIENPRPDTVWFWYDPSIDYIVQEEVEPYDVRGFFDSEDTAHQFLEWYADQYGTDDPTHLELYKAEIEYVDNAPPLEQGEENGQEEQELPEQAGLQQFQSDG